MDQHDARQLIVTSLMSRKIGAVNVDSIFEQREKVCLCKIQLSHTIVGGRDRRLSIQMLAAFEQPGTEQALRPIQKTVIRPFGFELITDQELVELSNVANVLSTRSSKRGRHLNHLVICLVEQDR